MAKKKIIVEEPSYAGTAITEEHPDHAWQRAQIGGGFLKCPVCNEVIPN